MKRLFFLICIFFSSLSAKTLEPSKEPYSIVFIHLGPSLPNYFEVAVDQVLLFNKCPIYLILNKQALGSAPKSLLKKITPVISESLLPSKAHLSFMQIVATNGFWRFTTERFFYLEEFLRQYNLKNVFHLENDVMLYIDLGKILSIFEKNYPYTIGATFDHDLRCIAGFLYIPEVKPLSELCDFIAYRAFNNNFFSCNDMTLLAGFNKNFHKTYIDNLPIIPPSYTKDHELKNFRGEKAATPFVYWNNLEKFNLIFDAAAIGQYLGGFLNETCLFNASSLTYIWEKDREGRLVPFMLCGGLKYPIANLHIHCKNLEAFYSLRPK